MTTIEQQMADRLASATAHITAVGADAAFAEFMCDDGENTTAARAAKNEAASVYAAQIIRTEEDRM